MNGAHLPVNVALAGDQLKLRRWSIEDIVALVSALDDAEIRKWMPAVPIPYGGADARAFIEATDRGWAEDRGAHLAIEDASGALVGWIALIEIDWSDSVAEVGYWVASWARGIGVATGALRLLVPWAFDVLHLVRLQLFTAPDNLASRRVAEQCGFVEEGTLRSHSRTRISRTDSVVYGKINQAHA